MPLAEATPPPTRRLLLIAGLIALACAAVLAVWLVRPTATSKARPDPASLARLPARPEDIEAHGQAATSMLAPSDARARNAAVPFAARRLDIAQPFAFRGSSEDRERALACLATVVLYEAGDDAIGQAAVAQVVLNRVRHAAFPGTVCGVVYQGAARTTGCQFTFSCDGSLRRTMSDAAWGRARAVAEGALGGRVDASVGLATHYHTDWVYPYWSPSLRKLARVGTHLFFGWPSGWGGPLAFARPYRGGERDVEVLAAAIPAPRPLETAAAGENAVAPGLGGFQFVPSRLPAGVERVPLYGTRVKLTRADGKAFGLLVGPDATAAKVVNAALALCATPGFCQVQAWSREDDIPGAYPIPTATRDTMVFEYTREGAIGVTRFDCTRFPNRDPKLCLRPPPAEPTVRPPLAPIAPRRPSAGTAADHANAVS